MSEFDVNDNDLTNEGGSPDTEYSLEPAENSYESEATDSTENAFEEAAPAEEIFEEAEPAEASAEPIYRAEPAPAPIPEPAPVPPTYTAPQYANPYQQPYPNNYQPYQQHPQTSRGYYRPDTNEYVYSPNPPKKKGNGGKILLITIVCLLSAFVISVASISVYNFIGLYTGSTGINDFYGGKDDKPNHSDTDDKHDDLNDPDDPNNTEDNDIAAKPTITEPVAIRDYPNIEQLAAPEDAMSIPDIYDKVSPSVVGVSCSVRGGTQTGTGFVISEDGYIVTNAHVIENYISVMIVDSDLNEYEAEVIGSDAQTDIAVLKIDPSSRDLVAVDFGISGDLRIGELAIAIGNPLGFELYGTMTTGIISGLNRTVTIGDNTMNLLQTSATINHGNSGGPLIDAYGRVIGITSAKVDTTYGESLGFAIPIDEAIPIIESLIKYGYVPGRPSLGIFSSQDITSLFSLYYRLPEGVYVLAVTPGSGAEKAGIRAGDVIIGIAGESITSMDELNAIKNQYAVGDTVTLTIYRGGQNFDVDVVLSETTPENSVYPGE